LLAAASGEPPLQPVSVLAPIPNIKTMKTRDRMELPSSLKSAEKESAAGIGTKRQQWASVQSLPIAWRQSETINPI
jgi:hypothetical protein